MSKKLAIKGHPTRGKEVIELLEMLGGKNKWLYDGSDGVVYFIEKNDKYITYCGKECIKNTGEYIIYELEEFLEKYPFKVNDKVIDEADGCPGVVCEMKWDEDVSDMKYCVAFGNGIDFGWFANNSINYFKIKKNENLEENKFPSFEPMFKMNDELEYKIPDGYEITEVSKGKVFIKPIKFKYPKTYAECCDILSIAPYYNLRYYTYEHGYNEYATTNKLCSLQDKLNILGKLLICLDAYWKIAGEELGLDKPWEPDWTNLDQLKYCIWVDVGEFITMINVRGQHILAFPSEEMRDVFYENFKDLIEQCKELL
jgi:hypothetical protein